MASLRERLITGPGNTKVDRVFDFIDGYKCRGQTQERLVIQGILNTPPSSPTHGQAWLIGDSPTGAWSGETGAAVWLTGRDGSSAWDFVALAAGTEILHPAETRLGLYDGTELVWQVIGGGSGSVKTVADYDAAKALPAGESPLVFIADPLRGGLFEYVAGDSSAEVTADPGEGIYIPFDSDAGGSEHVLQRVVPQGQPYLVEWFGAVPDAKTLTDVTVTDGAATVTSASHDFSGDQGKEFLLLSHDPADPPHIGTISGVSGSTATLNSAVDFVGSTSPLQYATGPLLRGAYIVAGALTVLELGFAFTGITHNGDGTATLAMDGVHPFNEREFVRISHPGLVNTGHLIAEGGVTPTTVKITLKAGDTLAANSATGGKITDQRNPILTTAANAGDLIAIQDAGTALTHGRAPHRSTISSVSADGMSITMEAAASVAVDRRISISAMAANYDGFAILTLPSGHGIQLDERVRVLSASISANAQVVERNETSITVNIAFVADETGTVIQLEQENTALWAEGLTTGGAMRARGPSIRDWENNISGKHDVALAAGLGESGTDTMGRITRRVGSHDIILDRLAVGGRGAEMAFGTNISTAFGRAIDQALRDGVGHIRFAGGNYFQTASVFRQLGDASVNPKGLALRVDGTNGARIICRLPATDAGWLFGNQAPGLTIENLHLDGAGNAFGSNQTQGCLIHIRDGRKLRVLNSLIRGARRAAILIEDSNGSVVEDTTVYCAPMDPDGSSAENSAQGVLVIGNSRGNEVSRSSFWNVGSGVVVQAVARGSRTEDNGVRKSDFYQCHAYGAFGYQVSASSTAAGFFSEDNAYDMIQGGLWIANSSDRPLGAGLYLQGSDRCRSVNDRFGWCNIKTRTSQLAPGQIGAANVTDVQIINPQMGPTAWGHLVVNNANATGTLYGIVSVEGGRMVGAGKTPPQGFLGGDPAGRIKDSIRTTDTDNIVLDGGLLMMDAENDHFRPIAQNKDESRNIRVGRVTAIHAHPSNGRHLYMINVEDVRVQGFRCQGDALQGIALDDFGRVRIYDNDIIADRDTTGERGITTANSRGQGSIIDRNFISRWDQFGIRAPTEVEIGPDNRHLGNANDYFSTDEWSPGATPANNHRSNPSTLQLTSKRFVLLSANVTEITAIVGLAENKPVTILFTGGDTIFNAGNVVGTFGPGHVLVLMRSQGGTPTVVSRTDNASIAAAAAIANVSTITDYDLTTYDWNPPNSGVAPGSYDQTTLQAIINAVNTLFDFVRENDTATEQVVDLANTSAGKINSILAALRTHEIISE